MASLQAAMGQQHDALATYRDVQSRFPADPRAAAAIYNESQLLIRLKASPDEIRQRLARIGTDYPGSKEFPAAMSAKCALEDRLKLREQDPVLGISVPASLLTRRALAEHIGEGPLLEITLWTLAEAYVDLKQYAWAAKAFEELATRMPGTTRDAWFQAGEIHERRLNNRDAAVRDYLRVPQSSSRYGEAQSRAKRLAKQP
jgi:TolA-binding protein